MARPSRYPDEFRREAVQMALATKGSWASIARRLGVNETTLRNWVHDHMAEVKRSENPLALKESEFEELRRHPRKPMRSSASAAQTPSIGTVSGAIVGSSRSSTVGPTRLVLKPRRRILGSVRLAGRNAVCSRYGRQCNRNRNRRRGKWSPNHVSPPGPKVFQ